MPIFTSKQPWVRRPSGIVTLNWGSALARGLNAWWVPLGGTMRDVLGVSQPSASSAIDTRYDAVLGAAGDFASDYVTVPSSARLQPPRLTLAAWVVPDALIADATIIKKDGSYIFRQASSDQGMRVYLWTSAFVGGTSYYATLTAGRPVHVVTTYDGATAKIYHDGRVISSWEQTGDIATTTNSVGIGAQAGGGESWDGAIGDVRLYARALSPAEVRALYDPRTRWELYAPIVRRTFFNTEGISSNIYNESLSFMTSTSLTPNNNAVFSNTLALNTNAGLNQGGPLTAQNTLSLLASVGMTPAAAFIQNVLLALQTQAGFSPFAGNATYSETLALNTTAGLTPLGTAVQNAVATYAASVGISPSATQALAASLALNISADIARISQLAAVGLVQMGTSADFAASSVGTFSTQLTMGIISVLNSFGTGRVIDSDPYLFLPSAGTPNALQEALQRVLTAVSTLTTDLQEDE